MLCRVIHASCVCRCIANRIHVLNLPAHTTHLLQVADISVFGPFKKYLRSVTALRHHQRNGYIQPQHVAALTKPAWEKAITRVNVITGFAKAGIVPFDRTKITAKTYQQGARFRHYADDSSRHAVPPVPPLPPVVLDSSSPPPAPSPSVSTSVETVSSILPPPDPLPIEPPSSRHYTGINTTYAVMLSQESIIATLTERKEQKEEKERAKEERKRKREEKKKNPPVKPAPKPRKKRCTGIRITDKLRNKENIPPTHTNIDMDPYDINHE